MISIQVVLLICAAVCFILGAFGVPVGRINTVALGLFFWVLTLILR